MNKAISFSRVFHWIKPSRDQYMYLLQFIMAAVNVLVHFFYLRIIKTDVNFIAGFLLYAFLHTEQRLGDSHGGFHVEIVQFLPAQNPVPVFISQPKKLQRTQHLKTPKYTCITLSQRIWSLNSHLPSSVQVSIINIWNIWGGMTFKKLFQQLLTKASNGFEHRTCESLSCC